MGRKKNRLKDKYYFFKKKIKHSKTSDNSTDLTAALLSYF